MKKKTVKGQEKVKRIPATGFHTNPERINRKGGPEKEWTWRQLVKDSMNEVQQGSGYLYRKVAVNALRTKAVNGDIAALKEVGDRIDGKAPQGIGTIDPDGEFNPQRGVVILPSQDGGT